MCTGNTHVMEATKGMTVGDERRRVLKKIHRVE